MVSYYEPGAPVPGQSCLVDEPDAILSAPSDHAHESARESLEVVIGTSQMLEDSALVNRIVNFSDKCEREVRSRLSMGDAGYDSANRLMHVALLNGEAVGWCSSATSGWGGDGHWGALSVDQAAQGKGVGSALVEAAEVRLLRAGCESVQIEYRFTVGNPAKERLYAWYEGKLGFDGGPRRSGFRCCHKELSAESMRVQHARGNPTDGRSCAQPEMYAGPDPRLAKRSRREPSSDSSCSSSAASSASSEP